MAQKEPIMHDSGTSARQTNLLQRAREMYAAGRLNAVRSLLNAARGLQQWSSDFAQLEARLLLSEDRVVEALVHLDSVIKANPVSTEARLCRAEAYMRAGNFRAALDDASQAVLLDPKSSQAKAVLGIVLSECGQFEEAAICLGEAVAASPGNIAFRQALAELLERMGNPAGADEVLGQGVIRTPAAAGLRVLRMMLALRARDFPAAIAQGKTAIEEGAVDARVLGLYGHALSSVGREDEAAAAYSEALKLAPQDPYVGHLVSAAGMRPATGRAPTEYIEVLFDGYAERFERDLISLGYRIPGLVRQEVQRLIASGEGGQELPPRLGPTLDLGCGTGLIGVVLSDVECDNLVGVDASRAMLARARSKGVYAELIESDLEHMLAKDEREWSLMIAADVLCYFGDLLPLFEKVKARLASAGALIFSIEEKTSSLPTPETNASGWKLERNGRYTHRRDYVERTLAQAGMRAVSIRREALRMEGDAEVPGLIVVAKCALH
jgi:predicted TPR repeat methyltransferase